MPKFGAHMSIAGGVSQAFDRGEAIGCDTIQLFTKNNRQWKAPPLKPEEVERFHQRHQETGIDPVVAHASYLLNVASPKAETWQRSYDALLVELERCDVLDIPYLVLHPGSHMGKGVEAGVRKVAEAINRAHAERNPKAMICLEVTAGQGDSLGASFEELAAIIEAVNEPERVGICFDTCHALAAGYDLTTDEGYAETFEAFERLLGFERLKVFHFNDSKGGIGSRLDRHVHIGLGACGLECFRRIINDPRFAHLPMILETPKGPDMAEDVINLRVLRGLVEGAADPTTPEKVQALWAEAEAASRTGGKT